MTFLIISVVIINLISFLIPKQMTKMEMYATSFFALCFVLIVDIFLDLKLDWYGYFQKGVQAQSLIAIFGLYPSVNIIFLNYFPFKKGLGPKSYYILLWSALIVLFEWASVKSGYFYHNEWKYWYSAIVAYPIILIILSWNLSLIRKFK